MKRRSIIWTFDKQKLQEIIDNCSSLKEVCEILDINPHNGSVRTLYRRIEEDSICTKNLLKNKKNTKRLPNIPIEFCKNSKTSRSKIKKYLIDNNIIDYVCHSCNIKNEWNGNPLILQLEHLNGINNDNRKENLAFICPNCHSQTKTFAGRNVKKRIFMQDKIEHKKETTEERLNRIKNNRKFDPSLEELRELLEQKIPFTTLGKLFGVSNTAVKKRCKYYNLIN